MDPTAPELPRIIGTPVSYGLEIFKDRQWERATIRRLLASEPSRLVTIVGRRGIGKSALAAKAIDELIGEVPPDGGTPPPNVVYLSSRTDGLALERLYLSCAQLLDGHRGQRLTAVWASQRSVREKVAELFQTFAQERCLILLDNLEDCQDADGRISDEELSVFIDFYFRIRHGLRVVVTTQRPVAFDPTIRRQVEQVRLDRGLPADDAVILLRELDPDADAGLRDADDDVLRRAAEQVHGIPRALELIAGALLDDFLTIPTLDEVLATFARRGDVLEGLANTSHGRLPASSRLALGVLAVFRKPVILGAVEFVIRHVAPAADAGSLLAHLARIHLVTVDRRSREYSLHPMDADIGYADLPEHGDRSRPTLELLTADWYAAQATPEGTWRVADDVASQRAEFDHRVRGGDHQGAGRIFNAVSRFLVWQGSAHAVMEMYEQIRGEPGVDPSTRAHNVVNAGFAHLIGGSMSMALPLMHEGIRLMEQLDEPTGLQFAVFNLGDALRRTGELVESAKLAEWSVALAERVSPPDTYAHALLCLALTYTYQGEAAKAHGVADRLHALAVSSGRPHIDAFTHDSRSLAYVLEGHFPLALAEARAAVGLYEDIGMLEPIGYTLNVTGLAHIALGDLNQAIDTLTAASRHRAVLENPRPRGICLFNLAWAHWLAGDHAAATTAARRACSALAESETDVPAAEALFEAARERTAGNLAAAARHLRATAVVCRHNTDLARADWLLAEADRLCPVEPVPPEGPSPADPVAP